MKYTKEIWNNYQDDTKKRVRERMQKEGSQNEISVLESEIKRKDTQLRNLENVLNVELEGRVLVIADVTTQQGKSITYGLKGANLRNILYTNYPEYKVGVSNQNVKGQVRHRLGEDYYEFREVREERDITNLLNKIQNKEKLTRSTINYYTKTLTPKIKEALREGK